jgi:hypothetical protein
LNPTKKTIEMVEGLHVIDKRLLSMCLKFEILMLS